MASPTPRSLAFALLALLAAAVLGLAACGSGEDVDPGSAEDAPDYSRALEAAPPELARLYEPGGTVLDGGRAAFERELARLEGRPIVVNKWASWCGPCRQEFPYLQRQAAEHADEVAFVGINANDSTDAATTFLRDHPIPYPSFSDPDEELARSIDAGLEFPSTVFIGADGEVAHVRRGAYASADELAADVDRYALAALPGQ